MTHATDAPPPTLPVRNLFLAGYFLALIRARLRRAGRRPRGSLRAGPRAGEVMTVTHAIFGDCHSHVGADPEPLRAPLPPLRRERDQAAFQGPPFASAVNAALDHVVDNRIEGLSFADVEQLCRTFLVHFIRLGGRL